MLNIKSTTTYYKKPPPKSNLLVKNAMCPELGWDQKKTPQIRDPNICRSTSHMALKVWSLASNSYNTKTPTPQPQQGTPHVVVKELDVI